MSDATAPAPGDPGALAARLAALADRYWRTFLETNPRSATSLGLREHDDRMEDPSPEGVAHARARYAALRADLRGIDPEALPERDRVTHRALEAALDDEVAVIDTGVDAWSVDPLEGIPTTLLDTPDYQRVETPLDGRRMVERWRAMGGYAESSAANLERALEDGRVACRAPVERVVAQLAELLAQPTADWPLLAPIATVARLEGWTTADRERFADDLRDAVEDRVRPALVRLHTLLQDTILPASRDVDRPGIRHVPDGEAAYATLARHHTSLEVTAEELHATGLAEIERIDAEMAELARRTIGALDLADALARLRGDPALHFATREEVRETAERSLARAQEALTAWFGRLPSAPCQVVVMGPHEEEHSTIAYYRQPAVDGSRPGQYFVNTSHPETRPRYEAETLAFHEAVPGHHTQIALGQELTGLPEFRRHLGATAFFEGWALYTERLSDEMGLYSGDLDRIGVLSFDAWRAGRLVVDTGMHALGWTRDDAIAFMEAHSALGRNNIVNEIDRYLVWPGQALAYKAGQLEILRLRRAAEARLGSSFDVRAFHDVVLGGGPLPLPALRGSVEAWVEGVDGRS